MFKPNGNTDRCDYGQMLLPPVGYQLEKAVGTTYSLDLEALTAVTICLGLSENTDSKLMQNPVCMLNALQKVSDKIVIFCESGQIKMPTKPSSLSILLEKMVTTVALPKDKRMGTFPAFHPKTWTLCYVNEKGERKYRFLVMSRNLTFDRSWDISFAMEGSDIGKSDEKTKPLIQFLEYLNWQLHNDQQNVTRKRQIVKSLMGDLQTVSFNLDSKEFPDFQIMPLGIGKNAYDMNSDILFCKERFSRDYTFNDLVIMSPFLTGSVIESFNEQDRGLKDCKRTLITRRSELGKLSKQQTDQFDIYVLKDEIVDGEEYISDEATEKLKQDIHAKIYLRRKYSDVDFYLGSMNASYAAINKNIEMMVRLTTSNRYLNQEKFLNDLFCGDADGEKNPFEKVMVANNEADEEKDIRNSLEKLIKELCRVDKHATVQVQGNNKYQIMVEFNGDVFDERISISPFRSNQSSDIQHDILFEDLDLLQISEFYEVVVKEQDVEIHRIIIIPTTGIPEEREASVVNSVVGSRKEFVEYIAFVLGDDYVSSLLEEKQLEGSGFYKQNSDIMPTIYEKMLSTSLENPAKLKDIGYVLKMISDKEVIPDEFRQTYEMFCKALNIK